MERVLLTGGAGFLGRAIIRHYYDKKELTIYSRDEEKQWRVKQRFPNVRCILGSIYDVDNLTTALAGHDTVLHLAAHKFVPEAEHNVWDAVRANVDGTMAVAQAAIRARVNHAVFISTDKACSPVNTYGMTKALGERIWFEADSRVGGGTFSVARYGNVIGSTGSAMPVMLNSIQINQKVNVTDPKMTRFFMPISLAIETIEASLMRPGRIVVPLMYAAKLQDVAHACAIIAGIDKVHYQIIGRRPGEKVHEQIVSDREMERHIETSGEKFVIITPETGPYFSSYNTGIFSSENCAVLTPQELAKQYIQTMEDDNALR